MKKLLSLLLLVLCGCNTMVYTRTSTDGSKKTVACQRWFWTTQMYIVAMDDQRDILVTVKSKTDAESVKAVAYGLSKGTVEGLVK